MSDQVEGCNGGCCAVFYFPSNPREIKDKIDEYGEYNGNDGMMLANMLIPLTLEEAGERVERFGIDPKSVTAPEGVHDHYFTCKYWDEDTRQCTVYEARPDMCATYPYEREGGCSICGVEGGCKNGSEWRGGSGFRPALSISLGGDFESGSNVGTRNE